MADSFDLTPVWLGEKRDHPVRDITIHEPANRSVLSIRHRDWKLIPQLGS